MFKRDDIPGGVERLHFLGKKAQELEERFAEGEDEIGIWAKETKDMLLGFAEGQRRNPGTFFDPMKSLLEELLGRDLHAEAQPFFDFVREVITVLGGNPVDELKEWGFGVTGGHENQQQKEEDKS